MSKQMENNEIGTRVLRDEISKCEDLEELKERIFPLLTSQKEQWQIKISEIISESGYTKTDFAKACGVSRVSVDKWCKGALPRNRETFLKIGMAANYNLEKMNQLLHRYGQYPALYSKTLEDCVCMFVINHDYGKEAINKYHYILNKIKDSLTRSEEQGQTISTILFDEQVAGLKDEVELESFIANNIAVFSSFYHKLYAYVKMCIEANLEQYPTMDQYTSSVYDLAQVQGWSSSLRQCVSAIRQNKWYPTRNKIISLGLHFSLEREQIDEMLELAHMEPLCAKNLFESVIIFILEDASLNDILNVESEYYDPDELCRYAREVLEAVDMPEAASFISELQEMDDEW